MKQQSTPCWTLPCKSNVTRKRSETWSKSWPCTIPCQTVAALIMQTTTRHSKKIFKRLPSYSWMVSAMISAKLTLSGRSVKSFRSSNFSIARLNKTLRLSRGSLTQTPRPSASFRRSSCVLHPLRVVKMQRRRRTQPHRKILKSKKKTVLKVKMLNKISKMQLSRNVKPLTSNRPLLSSSKVKVAKLSKDVSEITVTISRKRGLRSRALQTHSTRIRARLMHLKGVSIVKKRNVRSD